MHFWKEIQLKKMLATYAPPPITSARAKNRNNLNGRNQYFYFFFPSPLIDLKLQQESLALLFFVTNEPRSRRSFVCHESCVWPETIKILRILRELIGCWSYKLQKILEEQYLLGLWKKNILCVQKNTPWGLSGSFITSLSFNRVLEEFIERF